MNKNKGPVVIGICGGSGSGKTTLLRRIAEEFSSLNPSLFTMDNYYHPIEEQRLDENGIVNFDLPTALDEEQLTSDLRTLVAGKPIEVMEYFFNTTPAKNVLLTIQPSEIILVEGLFLYHYQEVHKLLTFSVFVDVDHSIQLDRRIYRDQDNRGYKRSDIIYQWENHVMPCFEAYIAPYRTKADFHFRNDQRAEEDFSALMAAIRNVLIHKQS
jgi:uridine kinase